MIIGIPKEIKNNENRVSLTPSGAKELTKRGHKVYVQATAGANSGFPDKDYVAAGAELLPTIEEVYAKAEMIIKVKEPIEPEYKLIRQGQLVFTYFHFASSEPLTRAMVESGAICCAYETVEASDRSLPLLIPMSEVAGRMATQEGCYFLEKPHGGKGKLLGGMPGVKPAKVFVIGAGVVGTAAARMAAGLGADVTICDISLKRLAYLTDVMPQNVKTLMSSEYNIREELKTADLVIGSRYVTGVNVVNWPMKRVLMSYYASAYVRAVTGMPVRDATAGFVCYSAKLLRTMDMDAVEMKGYGFQVEMKYTAWKLGFRIKEVPIIFTERTQGASKMSGGIFREAFFGVLKLRFRTIKPRA